MMKKLFLGMILVAAATPAWSQTKLAPAPKAVAGRIDPCAPIGQTASRELIYSMKCDHLPAPPPLPPQAEVQAAPAPPTEPEVQRSGLFGMSIAVPGGATGQGRNSP
jgi:hypothetical protein